MLAMLIATRTFSVTQCLGQHPVRICKHIRSLSVISGESLVCVLTIIDRDSPNISQHRPVSHETHGVLHEVVTVEPAYDLESLVH